MEINGEKKKKISEYFLYEFFFTVWTLINTIFSPELGYVDTPVSYCRGGSSYVPTLTMDFKDFLSIGIHEVLLY